MSKKEISLLTVSSIILCFAMIGCREENDIRQNTEDIMDKNTHIEVVKEDDDEVDMNKDEEDMIDSKPYEAEDKDDIKPKDAEQSLGIIDTDTIVTVPTPVIDNDTAKKDYEPGENIGDSGGLELALNSPSQNEVIVNSMGNSGVSGDQLAISVKEYVELGDAEEAPDGTKSWSGTSGTYSADIQADINGNVYVACFAGENEGTLQYLRVCASAINADAGEWVGTINGTGSFESGGMVFDITQRGNGYSMKVCSSDYINSLETPY